MFALKSGSDLIEAIPAVLGFTPVDSLIALVVERSGGQLDRALRVDLGDMLQDGAAEQLARLAAGGGGVGVILVVVSREGALCPECAREYRELVATMAEVLAAQDAQVRGAYVVNRIEAGGRWRDIDGHASGVLNDPAGTALAVDRVAAGNRLYKDRGEIGALIAIDPKRVAALEGLLVEVGPVASVSEAVVTITGAVRRVAGGHGLSNGEIAEIGSALADVRVRDRMAVVAADGSQESAGAESLWAALARCLPQPWRAEALALLALSAYVRGDGVLAGIALEAALQEAPEHRLAALLHLALEAGLDPGKLRGGLASLVFATTN